MNLQLEVLQLDPPMPSLDTYQKIMGFIMCINYGYAHGAIASARCIEMLQLATDALLELGR